MASLPPNFLDELRHRTSIRPLIARSVRLTRSGRDVKGCCPFHGEKTPSFYVYDDHFHCFGCGEHGDVITWVMKSQGASFMEAVEILAREAGLEVPRASPQAAEAEQRRAGITEVLEAAAKTYRQWLFTPEGKLALDYLHGRGLTNETMQKFGLGWSGEGRGALAAALRSQGINTEQLVEAGLMKSSDYGPVDMFFSRVMFPIQDRRGAVIGFSGRVLGDGQPKYVNGPETAVFSKRRSLYGFNFAREPVRKGSKLILVEGQMDVIALSQAGFPGAVAPLGTALTEEQLAEIWRLTPEPIICFDADAAGRRAALKTVDLALAALAPDRSLKFLRLPERDDPDSIIRREGVAAFKSRLEDSTPLSQALFGMLAEGASRDTPEERAKFYTRLVSAAGRISDGPLAREYKRVLLSRFFEDWAPGRKKQTQSRWSFNKLLRNEIKPRDAVVRRGYVILSILIHFPVLFRSFDEALRRVHLAPPCAEMFGILSDFIMFGEASDYEAFIRYLEGFGLEKKARQVIATAAADYRPDLGLSLLDAANHVWHFYYLLPETVAHLEQQRDEARDAWQKDLDNLELWNRLVKLEELLLLVRSGEFGQGAYTDVIETDIPTQTERRLAS